MRSGQGVLKTSPVRIPARVLPQHMGVFATTGMGKSNFMKTFCASCMKEKKFGLLIVDPHGEYVSGGQVIDRRADQGPRPLHGGTGRPLDLHHPGESDRKKYGMNQPLPRLRRFPDRRPCHPPRSERSPSTTSSRRSRVPAGRRSSTSSSKVDPEIFPIKDPGASVIRQDALSIARSGTPWRGRSGSSSGTSRTSSTATGRSSGRRARPCRRSSATSTTTTSSSSTSPTWASGANSSSSR